MENPDNKVLTAQIKGMDCSECADHVGRAIRSVPGVIDVQVYLGAEKANIIYQQQMPDFAAITQAVNAAGYQAIFPGQSSLPVESSLDEKEVNQRLIKILGIVFGLVLFVTVAGEWLGLLDKFTNTLPWYFWPPLLIAFGWPIFRNVIRAALKGQVISHTLMSLGVLAAGLVNEWPTAAVVVFFMRVGDFVESQTTSKARGAIKDLALLAPQFARVERGQTEVVTPVGQVEFGDIVVVRPGERIPVDGDVVFGSSAVDQSAITGESMPIDAQPGVKVYAATLVISGMLKIRTSAIGESSAFGKVVRLVEEAEGNRAQVQRVSDKFAGYYLPVVAAIALLTLIVRGDTLAAAATLVVACSCSFALATPVAMLASIGSAAGRGILIKGGKYLEALNKVDTLFIDKTGTITTGIISISGVVPAEGFSENQVLQLAASVERYSEHPLAKAVVRFAKERNIDMFELASFKNTPGEGVSGLINNDEIRILNRSTEMPINIRESFTAHTERGETTFFVLINKRLAGMIAATDTLRAEMHTAITALKRVGVRKFVLISGDKTPAVQYHADLLGIDFQAELLPEDKINAIRKAQAQGLRVAMVGDGINDAPALAQADVGIAMGATGSDIAIEAAHIALMRDDWLLVPEVFQIAQRTMRVVRLNILFTAIYNLAGLSLAALGYLPPFLAAALQSLPDVGILANSARLIKKSQSI